MSPVSCQNIPWILSFFTTSAWSKPPSPLTWNPKRTSLLIVFPLLPLLPSLLITASRVVLVEHKMSQPSTLQRFPFSFKSQMICRMPYECIVLPPCYSFLTSYFPFLLSHSLPTTLASWFFLRHARHTLIRDPSHWLVLECCSSRDVYLAYQPWPKASFRS